MSSFLLSSPLSIPKPVGCEARPRYKGTFASSDVLEPANGSLAPPSYKHHHQGVLSCTLPARVGPGLVNIGTGQGRGVSNGRGGGGGARDGPSLYRVGPCFNLKFKFGTRSLLSCLTSCTNLMKIFQCPWPSTTLEMQLYKIYITKILVFSSLNILPNVYLENVYFYFQIFLGYCDEL